MPCAGARSSLRSPRSKDGEHDMYMAAGMTFQLSVTQRA